MVNIAYFPKGKYWTRIFSIL